MCSSDLIYSICHIALMIITFLVVKLLHNHNHLNSFSLVILIFMVFGAILIAALLKMASSICQSIGSDSIQFLRLFQEHRRWHAELDFRRARSYRPITFYLRGHLPIDNATFAFIMNTCTLNGLLTLIINYR